MHARWRMRIVAAILLGGLGYASIAEEPTPAAPAEQRTPRQQKDDEEYFELYRALADTLDQVERNYVQEIDRRELLEAAIKGMLTKLDPYSSYINPEELGGFKTSVESQFGGIGIQISLDDGDLKILSPLVGTPAYRAGLQAGDRIVKIEDEPTTGITIDEAVKKLKGEVGTSVTLSVRHSGASELTTVTLTREIVHVETVLGDQRRDDDSWEFMIDPQRRIGYIRLTAFSRETAGHLRKALDDLKRRGLRGLVLDLRFNPGGLLTSAVEVADMFLDEGVIVSTEGRNSKKRVWKASKPGTFDGFEMVVLVNRYSASASEIVAASLQDHDRAVVIGERTWGKGSVQNVIELEAGRSALKLTTAGYLRPNGHNIHRFPEAKESDEWGVKPSEGWEVKLGEGELGRLATWRRQRDILLNRRAAADAPQPTEPKADAQPADEAKPREDDQASDAAKSARPSRTGDGQPAASRRAEFVDRQLQKAIEYLTNELARAD